MTSARMVEHVEVLADKLNLENVAIVIDVGMFSGEESEAKGF